MRQTLIRNFADLKAALSRSERPLLLFSGGLDGTYLLYYLAKSGIRKVVALTVDLGGEIEASPARSIADMFEARHVLWPATDQFIADFVRPAIQACSTYLGGHPICASLSRPLIAKIAIKTARKHRCDLILHTSNRSQNSLRRFNGALQQLRFDGSYGSPFDSASIDRKAKMEELRSAGIPLAHQAAYSIDANLWGREFEYGDVDDPENPSIPEHLFVWTRHPLNARPLDLTIGFRCGIPFSLNGVSKDPEELIRELNAAVGSRGIGRHVWLEEVAQGVKVQEVREMPAATLLFDAYRRLESACLPAEWIREKLHVEQIWVREAVEGRWFGSLRSAAQAFIAVLADAVTGSISYRIELNHFRLTSMAAENRHYIRDRRDYEAAGVHGIDEPKGQ